MTADGRGTGTRKLLKAFLTLVVVLLAWGLGQHAGRPDFEQALATILDGDLDRQGRLTSLAHIRDTRRQGEEDRLLAAMAALALNDRESFGRVAGSGLLPELLRKALETDAEESLLGRAALGEPYLLNLLRGLAAERRGALGEARRRYAQAERGARLWNVPLAADVARDRLSRLR